MSCMILDKHGSAEDNGGSAGQDMASRSGGETALELFGFGPHLMIDGYQANAARLADTELIKRVLAVMPEALVMTKVLPPLVFHYNGTTAEDSGVTGVVIIAESHIAIHAFPQRRFVSVDIFSCKEFDLQKAVDYLVKTFEIGRYETHLINRGKELPKDPALACAIIEGDREYLESRIA